MFFTSDFGQTWSRVAVPTQANLRAISFHTDHKRGWIVGDGGLILYTEDSGLSWEHLEASPSNADLLTITIRDDREVWIGGGHNQDPVLAATLFQALPPVIRHFSVDPQTLTLSLDVVDARTAPELLKASIEVEGAIPEARHLVPREFLVSDWQVVGRWPRGFLDSSRPTVFHLVVSNGWSRAQSEYSFLNTPTETNASEDLEIESSGPPLSPGPLEVVVDGEKARAQLVARGDKIAIKPEGDFLKRLQKGFHSLSIESLADGTRNLGVHVHFYKDEFLLRLFKPFNKSYAVVIAVSDYDSLKLPGLPAATRQANEFTNVLRDQGFEVTELTNSKATKENIEKTLYSLPAGENDRVLVYFGGHGTDVKDIRGELHGYFIPFGVKTTADLQFSGILLDDVRNKYAPFMKARQVLFLFDSCQSGLIFRDAAALRPDELSRFKALTDIEDFSRDKARQIMTAGTSNQPAIDLNGGVFTRYLIAGIQGEADRKGEGDGNGIVDFGELCHYVEGHVRVTNKIAGYDQQQPRCASLEGYGSGNYIFVVDKTLVK